MTQVKGTALQSSLRYVRERFGSAALEAVVGALSDGQQTLLCGTLLASSWYPLADLLAFTKEAERQLGAQEPQLSFQMGKASCDHGVTGIYKVFFKVGSPEFVVSRASRVFSSYYDSGELRLIESRDGFAAVEIVGVEPADPLLCGRFHGWMHRTLELAAARNLRSSHPSCRHRGDASCRFEGIWDARG